MIQMVKKISRTVTILLAAVLLLAGCQGNTAPSESAPQSELATQSQEPDSQPEAGEAAGEEVTILVAAAASLEYSYRDELIPMFQKKHPNIKVEGTYDSSGKLQTQIEEGLEADVFMSAAIKQMNALKDAGLVDAGTIVELLENRIVLIAPAGSESGVTSFEEIGNAETIALGDPESVPVGQYAQEALTTLGIYDMIQPKVSLGTNVTEVLNWVAEGSADMGIVYATDAATTNQVKVIAEAPEGSLAKKVIYPVGVVTASEKKEAAQLFVDFLATPEALAVFEAYGFTPNV